MISQFVGIFRHHEPQFVMTGTVSILGLVFGGEQMFQEIA
jgi:hypothetical protein